MTYHVEAKPKDFEEMSKIIKSEEELFFVYPSGKFPLTISQIKILYEDRRDFILVKEKYSLPEVRISVFSENDQALFLYIKLGFEIYDKELKKDNKGKSRMLFHMRMVL